jgi:DNA polymerase III subunit delta
MSETRVFLWHGNDEFAISQRLRELEKSLGDPTTAGMNFARFEARGLDDNEFNNAVQAMPFLAQQRIVVLAGVAAKYTSAATQKAFLATLEAVPPTAQLVLVEWSVLKDNNWLLKWAQAHAAVESFLQPRARELPGWIVSEAKKQGGKIDRQAAERLAEMVGEDTRQASQEIGKLLTYVNFARQIEIDDVERVAIASAQADIFSMVDALGEGNGKKAQRMLRRLLDDEDAFSLFGMIIRQFRLMLLAREALDMGANLAEAMGVAPFVAEKAAVQAKRFDLPTLESIYRRLLSMDEAAKTGQMPLDVALEAFVVQMARARR